MSAEASATRSADRAFRVPRLSSEPHLPLFDSSSKYLRAVCSSSAEFSSGVRTLHLLFWFDNNSQSWEYPFHGFSCALQSAEGEQVSFPAPGWAGTRPHAARGAGLIHQCDL